jgi:amino acid transporter
MFKLSDEDSRQISLLVKPSWISGLVAIVIGLIISVGVIVAFVAHNSVLQQQLLSWEQSQTQPALTTPSQTLPENNHPTLQGSWSLLILWSLAGLVVYVIAASVIHSLARAEELRESLDYVNARPKAMLASTAEHLMLRTIAAIVLVVFGVTFWRQIIPYSILASHASAADVVSLDGGLYALLSFLLIVISVHVQIILLRLTLGRARVFPRL